MIEVVGSNKDGEYYDRYTEMGQKLGSLAKKFLKEQEIVSQYTIKHQRALQCENLLGFALSNSISASGETHWKVSTQALDSALASS